MTCRGGPNLQPLHSSAQIDAQVRRTRSPNGGASPREPWIGGGLTPTSYSKFDPGLRYSQEPADATRGSPGWKTRQIGTKVMRMPTRLAHGAVSHGGAPLAHQPEPWKGDVTGQHCFGRGGPLSGYAMQPPLGPIALDTLEEDRLMVKAPPRHRRTNAPATADVHCVACATYRRPQDVPWDQHAIGCPLRGRRLFEAVQVITFGAPRRPIVSRLA